MGFMAWVFEGYLYVLNLIPSFLEFSFFSENPPISRPIELMDFLSMVLLWKNWRTIHFFRPTFVRRQSKFVRKADIDRTTRFCVSSVRAAASSSSSYTSVKDGFDASENIRLGLDELNNHLSQFPFAKVSHIFQQAQVTKWYAWKTICWFSFQSILIWYVAFCCEC